MRNRRDNDPPVRLPVTLPRNAWLVVQDELGTLLRNELLPAGTNLPERLVAEAAAYGAQGWRGTPAPGRWSLIVRKNGGSLVIGIRASRPGISLS